MVTPLGPSGHFPQLYFYLFEDFLRPIVSFVNSPTYELSKYLRIGWIQQKQFKLRTMRNWFHLMQCLFTSIPTDVAVQVARERLMGDNRLSEHTLLSPDDICELLSFCLSLTQFQFGERYYEQIHGTAMGSPVSVVVANLVMEDLGNKALQYSDLKRKIYKRFVDNTIAALKTAMIDDFHEHLNGQNSHIQFTIECYNPNGLAYLDTLIW